MASKVPKYKVHVNGQELTGADDANLQAITVDLRRQAPASVELQFNNESGSYDEHEGLQPGSTVEVSLGYEDDGQGAPHDKLTKVFEGEIIGTALKVVDNGPRTLFVRAFDYLHRLTRGRKTKTFLDQKFSDILSQVAQERGITPDAEDTAFVREYVIQHNQTDLDFVRGIAGWLDFDLHIRHLEDAKKLRFKAPEVGAGPTVKAVYEKPDIPAGDTYLRKFDGRQSLARVVSEVVVRGWDPKQKREIVGTAPLAQLYDKMGVTASGPEEIADKWGETDRQLVDYKVFSQEEADKVARTKLNEYARSFIRANVEIQGHSQVHPGSIVEIARIGPRYDGPYFVEKCSHHFTSRVDVAGGYTTRFVAARCGW